MGFREFINDRFYRHQISQLAARERQFDPSRATPADIRGLVQNLLSEQAAHNSRNALSAIGAAAVPELLSALDDPRFQIIRWGTFMRAPLPSVLELLVPFEPHRVRKVAIRLASSDDEKAREIAAVTLVSIADESDLPILEKLLNDENGYVRSNVCNGLRRALKAGRMNERFRNQAYDLTIAQCDQEWTGTLNDAAGIAIALDPSRAHRDLAERFIRNENRQLYRVLQACNERGISPPADQLRSVLEFALPKAVGEKCHPFQHVAAEALIALAISLGDEARPILESNLEHEQTEIQLAATNGLAKIAGVEQGCRWIHKLARRVGFDDLTDAQQVVYLATEFDNEVGNGGLLQFFGNPSGNRVANTERALRLINHSQAIAGLESAIRLIGPMAREPQRELRITGLEGRYDELKTAFAPAEQAFYESRPPLKLSIMRYAIQHAEHFKRSESV